MATIGQTWRRLQKGLEEQGLDPAPREGLRLVAGGLGCAISDLLLRENDEISADISVSIEEKFKRRLNGEPLAYVLGVADFGGFSWIVAPGVLIPRPDTEILLEEAKKALPLNGLAVEVGVGSGALLGSLLLCRTDAEGVGIELSGDALRCAKGALMSQNDAHLMRRCTLLQGDLLEPFAGGADVIISNPPYLSEAEWAALEPDVRDFEPKLALVGGVDGLDVYRRLIPQAYAKLKPGGVLAVEIGHTQGAAVRALFEAAGFGDVAVVVDLAGRDRVVKGKR